MKISIKVKINKVKSEIVEVIPQKEYIAFVRSRPHEGKANDEVIRLLCDYFGVNKSGIVFVSGQKSKAKVVDM